MNTKQKLQSMFKYLIPKDVHLANMYLNNHEYGLLKEIIDANVTIFERWVSSGQTDPFALENVKELQMYMNEFVEQYNIDIPYTDYEEVQDE